MKRGGSDAARVALVYALFGILWIFISDSIVERLVTDVTQPLVQTLKGFFYVGVTAFLVYVLVRGATRRINEERARYRKLYEHNERQLGALLAVTRAAARQTDPENRAETLGTIVEAVSKALGAERVSVWRHSSDRKSLACRALYTASTGIHAPGAIVTTDECPAYCRALGEHEIIAATDARADPRTIEFTDSELIPFGIASMLDAPLLIRGRPEGVLCVQHAGRPRAWSPMEQAFVVSIANLVSLICVQDELRESEGRFREMTENIQDLFYNFDPRRERLLYAGPPFERLWGRPLSEAYADPMSYLEKIHPDDQPAARDASLRQRRGEQTEIEYRVVRPDGSMSWILERTVSVIGKDGLVERIIGTMRDVTDIRLARDALTESRRQLSTLMDNLPGAVYRCRLDVMWTTLFMSEGITPLTGYRPADFMHGGRLEYAELIHPDDRERVYRDIFAAASEGRTFEIEYRLRTRDGREKSVWERGRFFPDPSGGKGHVEGFILDVTDREKAEAERRRMEERLLQLQKVEAIGQLAGGVAHDFNNMLTIILVRAEMALRTVPVSSPAHAGLREIHDAAERSAGLTRQLLTYARRQSVAPDALDLNLLVGRSLPGLSRLAGEGIRIDWAPLGTPAVVEIDPTQADQILSNLCLNARDAMNGTGTIRIGIQGMSLSEADCRSKPELRPGDYVVLSVTDQGAGMTRDVQARVFEPFFTTKELGKGTGLGLPTVHGIVRQAHGAVEIESDPGRGTSFHVYLPVSTRDPATVPAHDGGRDTMNALPPGNGETLLVVEQDAVIRRLASEILTSLGYSVMEAADGTEALRTSREHAGAIDLLMADVGIPDMDGRELADRFLALRPGAGRLFISDEPQDARGETPAVRKPFATAELAVKVREALENRPAGPAAA